MADFSAGFLCPKSLKYSLMQETVLHMVFPSVCGLCTLLLYNLGFLCLLDNSNALNPNGFYGI